MEVSSVRADIAAAKAGSPEGFESLVDAYAPRLYGYFLRATGNRHDAEDLLGELMLRLVRTLGSYDERGRFEPWLFRIAANLVRDRIRRYKARPRNISLALESPDGQAYADAIPGPAAPVDGKLLQDEAAEAVHEALQTLDESTRQMILLRHFAEMSFAEIARAMDCPIGTALAKVHRGLKQLRGKLEAAERSSDRPAGG